MSICPWSSLTTPSYWCASDSWVSSSCLGIESWAQSPRYRSTSSRAFFSSAWSRTICPSAWVSCTSKGRGSIWTSSSPLLTSWPSRNSTFVSSPSTRLLTVTVLSGVTEPRPLRYTPTSPCRAGTATTGTPRGGAAAARAARDWASPDLMTSAYAAPPRRQTASSAVHQRLRPADRGVARPGSFPVASVSMISLVEHATGSGEQPDVKKCKLDLTLLYVRTGVPARECEG